MLFMVHKIFNIAVIFCLLIVTNSCGQSVEQGKASKEDALDAELKKSVKQLEDRLSHKVITKKMIHEEKDSTLEDLIYSNIYVNIHATTDEDYKKELHKFSNLQQAVYATIMLERNFNEGHFYYYLDHFHYFSEDASKGYKLLGFLKLSEIVDQAASLYKKTPEKSSLHFAELDSLFAQQIKLDNTSFSRINLIRSNTDSFISKQ